MIKVNAHYSKKVPGPSEYSSEQAGASIEIEIVEGDAGNVQERLSKAWNLLRSAVDGELTRTGARQPAGRPSSTASRVSTAPASAGTRSRVQRRTTSSASRQAGNNGGGVATATADRSSGAGTGGDLATAKQIGYLLNCARRFKNLSAEAAKQWISSNFGKHIEELSKAEAGRIIDGLRFGQQ